MKIQATYIGNLFEYASYKGVPEEMLRNFLIDKKIDVCDQQNTVSEIEYLNVYRAIMDETADKNIGVHYGCYLNLKALGFIVQLSLNASSIHQAVFVLRDYLENTFPLVRLEIKENKEKYIIELSGKIEDVVLKNQVLDFVYCFIYRELRLMLSKDFIPELEVPNTNTSTFTDFLNTEVKKGRNYRFGFDGCVTNVEINRKKVKEIEVLLPQYLQMLDKKKTGYKSFSLQVRHMILNMSSPELPNFEQVASQFPFSYRTIQRKLAEEGLSFRKITDDIKKEMSIYLSQGHKMKTQDIAYLLGYSEASSYLHAAKKWETEMLS